MAKVNVKKGDKVVVITGKEKGKEGKVTAVFAEKDQALVEKVNMITKHIKPRGAKNPGGITKMEGPLPASNLMVVCPKCGKATRVAHEIRDDKKVRVCKKCGAEL